MAEVNIIQNVQVGEDDESEKWREQLEYIKELEEKLTKANLHNSSLEEEINNKEFDLQ